MCTFWLVEALTRAGAYDKKYLVRAINIFENMLSFSNHLGMFLDLYMTCLTVRRC